MLKRIARDIFRGILREVVRDMYRRQSYYWGDREEGNKRGIGEKVGNRENKSVTGTLFPYQKKNTKLTQIRFIKLWIQTITTIM